MESEEPNNQASENKKRYKMSLLLTQTKELRRMYNKEMEASPKQYYLVSKEWLDKYKQKNEYNKAIEMFKNYEDWQDYEDFRKKILQHFKIDTNDMTNIESDEIINNFFDLQTEKLENADITYPKNVELVKREYCDECLNGVSGFPLYEVTIGYQSIIIKDEQNDKCLFCCGIVDGPENDFNFEIKIRHIMAFPNSNLLHEELDQITNNGLNEYLTKKKN